MRVHLLQHVPFEGPAAIATWADQRQHTLSLTHVYREPEFPVLDVFDLLVVLGGPMNVADEPQYPWLVREKEFLKTVIEAQKPLLGICLGAQLIANVLGARIRHSPKREIGWFPVRRTEESDRYRAFKELPRSFDALHWHRQMFDIPEGAVRLASSSGCLNQAFGYADHVLALQFHLESTAESAESLVRYCPTDPVPDEFVQDRRELLSMPERFQEANRLMADMLDQFVSVR